MNTAPHAFFPSAAFAAAAALSTGLGGVLALRLRAHLHRMMGFAAGVVIGMVCFDLMPEIISQINSGGFNPRQVMGALAAGFLLFHVLEKSIIIHHHDECAHGQPGHQHPNVGVMSALALIGHSAMDGVGIGLGFQMSWKVGLAVGLAVMSHDFVDGMNTVILMLGSQNTERRTIPFLVLDSVAPLIGLGLTCFFALPPFHLTVYLAFFAGFLLYIGAAHILPEAHSENSSGVTVALTLAGALLALGVSLAL